MGRIRALAIAVQRRGCHAVHRPSSPTLVRGRLRRAGKEASGSAVPFGESSLAPPSLLPSVAARLSLLPERSGVIPELNVILEGRQRPVAGADSGGGG